MNLASTSPGLHTTHQLASTLGPLFIPFASRLLLPLIFRLLIYRPLSLPPVPLSSPFLLQALDFLHTQLLAGLCVASPSRSVSKADRIVDCLERFPPPLACRLTPPREASRAFPPPTFRCWLGKKVSPNLSIITLKCDSTPWANYFTQGSKGPHFGGFTPGNLLQLTFKPEKADAYALALYLTSVTHPGRVGEEKPSSFSDKSATCVTQLSGILLPFLLRTHLFAPGDNKGAPVGLLKLTNLVPSETSSLVELPPLPPLLHNQSFHMQVSAIRSFFTHITHVPFYRIPKTLGWPTLNSSLGSAADTSSFSLPAYDTLFMLLKFLPNFFPEEVRSLISPHKETTASGLPLLYSLYAYAFLQQHGIVPGSASTDMDTPYILGP